MRHHCYCQDAVQIIRESKALTQTLNISLRRTDKRIRVALPLRIRFTDAAGKPCLAMACTYDISARGARITTNTHQLTAGERITIERGRNKLSCQVVWVGDSESGNHGLMGIEFAGSAKGAWDAELGELMGMYDALPKPTGLPNGLRPGGQQRERRHYPRVKVESPDQILKAESGQMYTVGRLEDISELGCRIVSDRAIARGTDLELTLRIGNCELAFNGLVKRATDRALGIEFYEVRKGDREILRAILEDLSNQQLEESFELEVSR